MTELMPSLCNDCVARNQCGNDNVKMCASYTEEVKIKCDGCKFVDGCVDYGWSECKKFTQKPSTPMTNEEYLKSLDTEQLAEFIATQCADAIRLWRDMQYWTAHEKCKSNKWYVWLKEIRK